MFIFDIPKHSLHPVKGRQRETQRETNLEIMTELDPVEGRQRKTKGHKPGNHDGTKSFSLNELRTPSAGAVSGMKNPISWSCLGNKKPMWESTASPFATLRETLVSKQSNSNLRGVSSLFMSHEWWRNTWAVVKIICLCSILGVPSPYYRFHVLENNHTQFG